MTDGTIKPVCLLSFLSITARSLTFLVEEVNEILINHREQFEIILVNDGSRDNSWKIIEDLSSIHPEVRGVNLIRISDSTTRCYVEFV